jgi:hypothetical protein
MVPPSKPALDTSDYDLVALYAIVASNAMNKIDLG